MDISYADTEISVDVFTRDNFPAEFENQVFDPAFAELGTIYSSKDLNKLVLMNAKFALNSKLIHIAVGPCNEAKVGAGCASETET